MCDQTKDENRQEAVLANYIFIFLGFGERLKYFHLGIKQMDVLIWWHKIYFFSQGIADILETTVLTINLYKYVLSHMKDNCKEVEARYIGYPPNVHVHFLSYQEIPDFVEAVA